MKKSITMSLLMASIMTLSIPTVSRANTMNIEGVPEFVIDIEQHIKDKEKARNARYQLYAELYGPEEVSSDTSNRYTLTAYCPCAACCGTANNPTASGVMPTANHTIAADLSIYPIGTKISINGTIYTVEDTGGAINGRRFDIYFNSHQEALNFGRQHSTGVFVVN